MLLRNTANLTCREDPTRGRDMANKRFVVKFSGEERKRLSELISKGKASAKTILKDTHPAES
jgi:hypothetical protein